MTDSARDRILEQLRQAEGGYVSGQRLARLLDMSRAAVWKHVRALRALGYGIDGRSNAGYRLRAVPDLPLREEVERLLQTGYVGRSYHFCASVASTNTDAKRLAEAGAPEGTVVVADEQREGRGRRGRRWQSSPGSGVWMSVVLRPTLPPARAGALTLMAAVAAREAVREATGVVTRIKWPNDILVGERKLCGILLEMAADHEATAYAVVGIGLNVRRPRGGFRGAPTATTLEDEAGRLLRRAELVATLCDRVEHWYDTLRRGERERLLQAWRAGADWLGGPVRVLQSGRRCEGIAEDITDDGGLRVRDAAGRTHVLHAGDVSLLVRS